MGPRSESDVVSKSGSAAEGKSAAALKGISLHQFFIEAVHQRLSPEKVKVRRAPPTIGDAGAPPMRTLTRDQIDEAMFG